MPFKQPSVNQKRPYDAKWQRLRAQTLRAEPICRMCLSAGKTVPANVVDHILPIADGGTNETSNLMPLCFRCHNGIKTPADIAQRKRIGRSLVSLRVVWIGAQVQSGVDYRVLRRMFYKASWLDAHTVSCASAEGILVSRGNGSLPSCDLVLVVDDARWAVEMGKKYRIPVTVDEPRDEIGESFSETQSELDYLRSRLGLEYQYRKALTLETKHL